MIRLPTLKRKSKVAEERDQSTFGLLPGEMVCGDCGAQADPIRETFTVTSETIVVTARDGGEFERDYEQSFEFARCSWCRSRRLQAEAVIDGNDALRRRLGSRSVAVDKLDAALSALDAIGVRAADVDRELDGWRSTMRLIEGLGYLGTVIPLSRLFSPTVEPRAPRTHVAYAQRWGHVDDSDLARIRVAYADVLAARLGLKTREVAPPAGEGLDGCIFCGRATAPARRGQDADDTWGRIVSVQASLLGGRPRPEEVRGFLCPICRASGDQHLGIGMTWLESAYIAFLGIDLGSRAVPQVEGLRAWGALPIGTPPNRTPWQHERDHEGIRDDLRAYITARPSE